MNLLTTQGNGKTSDASARRKINLEFIRQLQLDDLVFQEKEKMLLLYTTAANEKLYLQYPGKESARENGNSKDFRPKLFIDGIQGKDLSFGDVWASFFDMLKTNSIEDAEFLKAVDYMMIIFYKSAYLLDTKRVETPVFETKLNQKGVLTNLDKMTFQAPVLMFNVDLHIKLITFLQRKLGDICGMSVEAFILYNDILGWNEDYKYYVRELGKGGVWAGGVGKPNNLLTHISILGYIRDEFGMAEILKGFVVSRGVSAPTKVQLQKLFDDYINPELALLS